MDLDQMRNQRNEQLRQAAELLAPGFTVVIDPDTGETEQIALDAASKRFGRAFEERTIIFAKGDKVIAVTPSQPSASSL